MKIDFRKIDFKQGKYWFPLVLFVPIVAIAYFSCQMFAGTTTDTGMVTDSINTTMPDPESNGLLNKYAEMEDNLVRGNGYTAINELGENDAENAEDNVYSENEMDRIDREKAAKKREEQQMAALQQQLRESRLHINAYDDHYTGSYSSGGQQRDMERFEEEMRQIQERSRKMARDITEDNTGNSGSGNANGYSQNQPYPNGGGPITGYDIYGNPIYAQQPKKDTVAVVTKADTQSSDGFNTVADEEKLDDPLIKAMIDKTTKAHEGTRLRFKLLDDVIVKGVKLKKGTYLYGTVVGFGQQRVMADITSILVKDKFLKIHLSVYDLDGMQGFYVPESAFRDMMKNAGSAAMQSNISFDSGSSGISAEALALQALQNVYQSTSSAVSQAIKKNRAKIKYNTIVYLINEQ